jgi:ribosome maturation factor RimP
MAAFVERTESLWKELESVVSDEGLSLYDLERTGDGGLRVFVANPASKPPSATSGDCSRVCRRLMSFFSVNGGELGLPEEPSIEVSSPGVNRHLRLPEHFSQAQGERVKLTVRGEISTESGETFKPGAVIGTLAEVIEAGKVSIREERTERCFGVALEQIAKAQVDFKFS